MRRLFVLALAACGGSSDTPPPDAPTEAPDANDIVVAPPAVCSPIPPVPDLPPSGVAAGTRLVPRTITADGMEVPWAVHDTLLDIDCTPLPYEDGAIRCVPAIDAIHLVQPQYADLARTIPITIEPLAAAPAAGTLAGNGYGAWTFPTPFGCSTGKLAPFGRIGAPRQLTEYFEPTGAPLPIPAGYAAFDLDVLAPDFVALTEVRTHLVDAIAVRELHGSDDSRLFATHLYDLAHDVAVAPANVDNQLRLMPPSLPRLPPPLNHRDRGPLNRSWCSVGDPLFAPACESPRFVWDHDSFFATNTTFEVVQQTATLFGCFATGEGPIQEEHGLATYLTPCDAAPTTAWAAVEPIVLGTGRLTVAAGAIDGAVFAPPGSNRFFHDAAVDSTCRPALDGDGALRCLPLLDAAVAYADAACTQRIALPGNGPGKFAAEGAIPSFASPDFQGRVTVYAIGAPRPMGDVHYRTPDGCSLPVQRESFELGAVVPPSAFAAMALRDVP